MKELPQDPSEAFKARNPHLYPSIHTNPFLAPSASVGGASQNKPSHENHHLSQSPKPEPAVCHEPVAEVKGEKGHTGRVRVSIVSFRKRLIDADNLAGGCKYVLDCVKYSGLIKDDAPDQITLEVSQEKVTENERTEITIL